MNSEKSTPDTHNTQNIKSPHCQPSQKLCKANPRFRHLLIRIFWISLLFSIGFIWYTFDRQIPDRVSLTRNETGSFSFGGLPLEVTNFQRLPALALRDKIRDLPARLKTFRCNPPQKHPTRRR